MNIFLKNTLFLWLLFSPLAAFAQLDTSASLDSIVVGYQSEAGKWENAIFTAAFRLFFILAAIDLAWMGINMLFKKMDIMEFLGSFIQRVMIIGFFLILLTNGTSWATLIINSFRELASNAGGVSSITPSGVMDVGLSIAVNLINGASGLFNLANTIISGILALIIMFIFILITAELIIILISMYIILNAGIIMLGLGGSQWTQQFAVNYFKTVLAIGVRVFIVQLLIGLGVNLINNYVDNLSSTPKFAEMFIIAGSVAVLYLLIKSIGSLVQSLISGSGDTSTGGTGALVGAALGLAGGAAAGAAMAGTVASNTVGAGQAVNSASKLASQAISDGGGSTRASQAFGAIGGAIAGSAGAKMGESLGLGLSKVAGTVSNLGQAATEDYSKRVKGEFNAESGTLGGRMAQAMSDATELNSMEKGGGNSSSDADNYISGVPPKN